MTNESITRFAVLTEKIQELLELVSRLHDTHGSLQQELAGHEKHLSEKHFLERITELENDLRKLRKENKTLKERERLIRNKVERLSVKLEKLEV